MFLYPSKSNRNGLCLFYRKWLCPLQTLSPQQDHKLMFGLVFSVKSFTTKMDPSQLGFDNLYPLLSCNADEGNFGFPQLPGQGCSFHSFRTNTYKLSFMESPSRIKVEFLFIICILHFFFCINMVAFSWIDYAWKIVCGPICHIYFLLFQYGFFFLAVMCIGNFHLHQTISKQFIDMLS
ncbi:hypothetical protein AMTRI_Chr12g233600 [Amborella trichopoda]